MTDQAKIQNLMMKIQGLQGLATSSNPNEAGAAAAKIQQLLQDYHLNIAEIETVAHSDEIIRVDLVHTKGEFQSWRVDLATSIAEYNFCALLYRGTRLMFVGKKVDVDVVIYIYNNLSSRLLALALEAKGMYIAELKRAGITDVNHLKHPNHPRSFMTSWLHGAVVGVDTQLKAQHDRLLLANGGRSLVVVRQQELNDAKEKLFSSISTENPWRSIQNRAGLQLGHEVGRTMQVQVAVGGADHTEPLRLTNGH